MRCVFALAFAFVVSPTFAAAQSLVIRGGSLFDSITGAMSPVQAIVIQGGKITAVGTAQKPVEIPKDVGVIDAAGKFLIPGLIDAHVHLVHQLNDAHLTGDEILPMFLAAGVTSVRDVGDTIVPQKLIARYTEAHAESCPRVFMCSPLIDGSPPFHRDIGWSLTDPNAVPAFVDDMAKWGVTTLKIYARTPREVGKRVIEEGHKHGLVVTAHLGPYSAQDAAADGIDCLEHIWSVFNYIVPAEVASAANHRATLDLNNPVAKDLIATLAKKRVMVDPTLAVFRNMILLNDLESVNQHPDNARAPARLREHWENYRRRSNLNPSTRETRHMEFKKYQELTGILYRAGVPILAGTDTPEPFVPPGFSLLQELEMLVESGLPPAAALQAATINNARALKQEDRLGAVAAGKLADLVILDADPTADIRNTRKIARVIRGGIDCDPAKVLQAVPAK